MNERASLCAALHFATGKPINVQTACDRCSVGVMDSTNPHLYGECDCSCHQPPADDQGENACADGRGWHEFEFVPGTTVELGMDAGWFCVHCGKANNRAYRARQVEMQKVKATREQTAELRAWAERHAYELFLGMLVLVICELVVFSAVPKP